MFSIVNGVLFEAFPYQDPGQLVLMFEHIAGLPTKFGVSAPDFEVLRREARSFTGMAAYGNVEYELSGIGQSRRLTGARVSPELFSVLGVAPAIGRAPHDLLQDKNVDAVVVATPDHWHALPSIHACQAGKDVYVEKPLSNTLDRAVSALKAYRGSNRVVQLGTQQRSGQHFQDAAEIVQSGALGKVTHAVLMYPGSGYGRGPEPETPPPPGLNWDLFEGPAARHPYKVGRHRSWRGYWDYGGGLITDWGVHLTDVALWYLKSQSTGPLLTSASAQYVNLVNPEHDQSPDAFSVTWQYPGFVMTFTNVMPDPQPGEFDRRGNYFFGPLGTLLVNRMGYEMRPRPQFQRGAGPGGRAGAPGVPAGPPPPPKMPFEYKRVPFAENYGDDPHTIAHARNFLDCIKSRRKPVSDLEIGFNASLPCILGVMAVREGRVFKWDPQALKAVPVLS